MKNTRTQEDDLCLLENIEVEKRLLKKKKKIAVFDIDGTIFRDTLMVELMKTLIYFGVFPKSAEKEVDKQYFKWVNREGSFEDYIDVVLKVFLKHIPGCKIKEVIRYSERVASYFRGRVHVYTKNLFEKLRKDYVLILISGSPDEVVEEYNKYLKFDIAVGSILEKKGDVFGNRFCLNAAWHKDLILKKILKQNKLTTKGSIGIGDSGMDVKYLKMMEKPIAFNPNIELAKVARRKGWKIVVERKDVIYEFSGQKYRIIGHE